MNQIKTHWLSNTAGAIYAIFFYIKFIYGVWDFYILWTGNIAVIVGLILTKRMNKITPFANDTPKHTKEKEDKNKK